MTAKMFGQRPSQMIGIDVQREPAIALDFDEACMVVLAKKEPPDKGAQFIIESLGVMLGAGSNGTAGAGSGDDEWV
jgi:hypothetical protein